VPGKSHPIATPPELPLLGALSKLEGEVDFSNTVLVGIQHFLASNISMLVKLCEAGLDYRCHRRRATEARG
jgi:hypothetical protein